MRHTAAATGEQDLIASHANTILQNCNSIGIHGVHGSCMSSMLAVWRSVKEAACLAGCHAYVALACMLGMAWPHATYMLGSWIVCRDITGMAWHGYSGFHAGSGRNCYSHAHTEQLGLASQFLVCVFAARRFFFWFCHSPVVTNSNNNSNHFLLTFLYHACACVLPLWCPLLCL